MTDPELQELTDLWQQPNDADNRAFKVLARKARRQGRLLAFIDVALVLIIGAGGLVGAMLKPAPATGIAALLMIIGSAWLTWKRRALRQMSLTLATGDPASFLESSIRIAKLNLRRVTLSMIAFPPLILTALAFQVSYRRGGEFSHPLEAIGAWAVSVRGIFVITGLILLILWMLKSRLRLKAELRRLEEVQQEYQEDIRLDRSDEG